VAAAAPSGLHQTIRIGDAAPDDVVHAGHDVEVRVLEVVPDHVALEGVAVAGAATVVRLEHGVSFAGEHLQRVRRVADPVLVRGLRPAVRQHGQRVLRPGRVVHRVGEESLDRGAVSPFPLNRFLATQLEVARDEVEHVRHPHRRHVVGHRPDVAGVRRILQREDVAAAFGGPALDLVRAVRQFLYCAA
jgi:hypothetical protein